MTDRSRPSAPSFRGEGVPVQISQEVTEKLRESAREQGSTLFMAVLAGFSVLLGLYSGQDEVVIGSPVAGRTRSETEGLIGFFVNIIVLRCDLRGNPSFREEMLARIRDRAVQAYAHQDLPFENSSKISTPTVTSVATRCIRLSFTWSTHHPMKSTAPALTIPT